MLASWLVEPDHAELAVINPTIDVSGGSHGATTPDQCRLTGNGERAFGALSVAITPPC